MKTLDDDRLRNLAANNDLWREEVAKSMNEADLSLSVRQSASSSKHFNSTFSFSIFYYLDLDFLQCNWTISIRPISVSNCNIYKYVYPLLE